MSNGGPGGLQVGIDVGGTTIMAVVVDEAGQLLALQEGEVGEDRGVDAVLDRALELAAAGLRQLWLGWGRVQGIGLALPGEVDVLEGRFRASPILPDWREVPLRELVMARVRGPRVAIENDANAALLAEHRWGAARGVDSALLITIGTGIGGAVLSEGRLLRGNEGSAGEIGHLSVETGGRRCWCGGLGCLGLYGSTTALLEDYARRRGPESGCATGRELARRYIASDADARAAVERTASYLARGIAAAAAVLAPEKVILFGGILDSLAEPLLAAVEPQLRERHYPRAIARVRIEAAHLGARAGALGAALLPEVPGFELRGCNDHG